MTTLHVKYFLQEKPCGGFFKFSEGVGLHNSVRSGYVTYEAFKIHCKVCNKNYTILIHIPVSIESSH